MARSVLIATRSHRLRRGLGTTVVTVVSVALPLVLCLCGRRTAWAHSDAPPRAATVKVPPNSPTLSVLEPEGGGCVWRRLDPVAGRSGVVATFEGDCFGARVSFAMDGSRAAVWFDPSTFHEAVLYASYGPRPRWPDEQPRESMQTSLCDVTVATGHVRRLPLPKTRGLAEVAYGPKGLLAFTVADLTQVERTEQRVVVDGKAIAVPPTQEGEPAVARAWREAEGRWKPVETKVTTRYACDARDFHALDAAARLGPRSGAILSSRALTGTPPESFRQALEHERLPTDGDEWAALAEAAAPVFVLMAAAGEGVHTTSLIRLANGESIETPQHLDYAGGELVSVTCRGPYLLVAGVASGTHPRLYDVTTRTLVWTSDTARAVTFWPTARSH
jgi:hypothetical protein